MYPYFVTTYSMIFLVVLSALLLHMSPWFGLILTIPLAVVILLGFKNYRVRCRVCSFKSAPSTEKQLKQLCEGKDITVVGQGWSFFLKRRIPTNPVFTHNFTSLEPEKGRWKSGTLVKTVTEYYEKKKIAFPSLPSYQNITLGGWIMTKSHGSSGDKGLPSSYCFDKIWYLTAQDSINVATFDKLNISDVKCILYVSFKNLVSNTWLHKIKVKTFEEWISEGAYQRVCFVGQSQEVMIRWELKPRNPNIHNDPHFCSRFCLWFQADICTTVRCAFCNKINCPGTEANKRFESNVKLSDANRFVPFIYPIYTAFLCDQMNFELILKNQSEDQVEKIYKIVKRFHIKYGGRTEFRYGKTLFIDVSVKKRQVHKYLDTLNAIGYSFHLGKFIPKHNIPSGKLIL